MTGGVQYPKNILTQMIERASAQKVSGQDRMVGMPQGLPTVRSSDLGTVQPEPLPPLTPEEKAELDAKAEALGILPHEQDVDGLVFADSYASDEDVAAEMARVQSEAEANHPPAPPIARETHRQHMGHRQDRTFVKMTPTMPDFSKIERIDFTTSSIIIDGMSFPLPPENSRRYCREAIATVSFLLQEQFKVALAAFAAEVPSGDTGPAVPEVRSDGQPDGQGESV